MNLIRSFLFAPGSNPKVMRKALDAGADAVVLDLEDAVAVSAKEQARELVAAEVRKGCNCSCFIRINSWNTSWSRDDLKAAINSGADGIMLPKAEDAEVLKLIAGQMPEDMELLPLIETAVGILNALDIASSSSKINRLAFGAMDFTGDIGAEYSKDGSELLYARSHLVITSRSAGIAPPVDTVYPDLKDGAGLEAELARSKQLGMFGKLAIHPKQLSFIHRAFTPTAEEIDGARRIAVAFAEAEKQGLASIQVDGKFVDYPIAARSKKTLELARLAAEQGEEE